MSNLQKRTEQENLCLFDELDTFSKNVREASNQLLLVFEEKKFTSKEIALIATLKQLKISPIENFDTILKKLEHDLSEINLEMNGIMTEEYFSRLEILAKEI